MAEERSGKLEVHVVTPEQEVWTGEADMVVATAIDGEIGILPDHAPLLAALDVGRLSIDTRSREAMFDGAPLVLSRLEYLLLQTLAERAGRVVARDFLERVLYGERGVDSNALEVHVHSLRRKTGAELIRTARGIGYVLLDGSR